MRRKVKQSYDTIHLNSTMDDPYGIDEKYDRYVVHKTPTDKKMSQES